MSNLGYKELREQAKCIDYFFTQGMWHEVYDTETAFYSALWAENSMDELPFTIKVGHKRMPVSFQKVS